MGCRVLRGSVSILLVLSLASAAPSAAHQAVILTPPALRAPAASRLPAVHEAGGPDRAPSRRWALVLSGGLARGIAHVGVLRAIEEEGLRPDLVIGTSMGALVGAMWASGRSSQDLTRHFKETDSQSLFDPQPDGFEWRRTVIPRPWFTLFGAGVLPRLPTGVLDDAHLNELLARHMLVGDALAQGDFDRLPIPFRAVATEAATLDPAVLDSGSLAQAVRASISIPMIFPAVWREDRLLVDGGVSKHLGIVAAHAESTDHVLAIDVAIPIGPFTERTPALQIGLGVLQLTSRSGRADARPGRDHVLWLKMPGLLMSDLERVDDLIEAGYQNARPVVARLAREWNLPRAPRADTNMVLPPLGRVTWVRPDGRPARRAAAAQRILAPLPQGPFAPGDLGQPLARVARADLFQSAWPAFRSNGGHTDLAIEVREHPPLELAALGGYDRDVGARASASLYLRPIASRPALVLLNGSLRRFGREAYASLEPRSLAHGARGLFARGGGRRTDHRIFAPDRSWTLLTTRRVEAMVGGQWTWQFGYAAQLGFGAARVWTDGIAREHVLGALRVETIGRSIRHLDVVAGGGTRPYASVRGRIGHNLVTPLGTLRPSVIGGWASPDAPLDEWHGLGGPNTLAGLRRDEWFGRRALGLELRLTRGLVSGIDLHAVGHAGRVERAISRPDLEGRTRLGGAIGVRASVPFGPLQASLGISEGGVKRWDLSFGQEF